MPLVRCTRPRWLALLFPVCAIILIYDLHRLPQYFRRSPALNAEREAIITHHLGINRQSLSTRNELKVIAQCAAHGPPPAWTTAYTPHPATMRQSRGKPRFFHRSFSEEEPPTTGIAARILDPITGEVVTPKWTKPGTLRENGVAGSISNRHRQLALAILCLGLGNCDFAMGSSIRQWIKEKDRTGAVGSTARSGTVRILNTEATNALHKEWNGAAGYVSSEYIDEGATPGATYPLYGTAVRHEDLQATSFKDNSFDLVITSEVFEHIPHPYTAHREILRILKPGGKHIFTAPFSGKEADTFFSQLRPDGSVVHPEWRQGKPLLHGDPVRPDQGTLVYTFFGEEMLAKLCTMGYNARAFEIYSPLHGIRGAGAIVFEAENPQ